MPRADGHDQHVSFPLVEGVDFYMESGRWVFTAEFLRKRGYCCGSGCRHCPYQPEVSGQKSEIREK